MILISIDNEYTNQFTIEKYNLKNATEYVLDVTLFKLRLYFSIAIYNKNNINI